MEHHHNHITWVSWRLNSLASGLFVHKFIQANSKWNVKLRIIDPLWIESTGNSLNGGPPHTWWCHQMETFSALLALCAGNSPVAGEFHAQRPVTRGFDVFFDLRLNKRLSKQSRGWWFETPAWSLWRHRNDGFEDCNITIQHYRAHSDVIVMQDIANSLYSFYAPVSCRILRHPGFWIVIIIKVAIIVGIAILVRKHQQSQSQRVYYNIGSTSMMTSSNGNSFCFAGPLWGESTGHRWIPFTKASDAKINWNRHFPDDSFEWKFWILNTIWLKCVSKISIDNDIALVQIMAWCRTCDKPLSEWQFYHTPTYDLPCG